MFGASAWVISWPNSANPRAPNCQMLIPFAKSNFRKGSDALPGVAANQQVSPTFIGNYFWQPL